MNQRLGLSLAALVGLLLSGTAAMAAPWKPCTFNDELIPCRDTHSRTGTVRITWEDGLAMTYRLIKEGFPFSTLEDRLGGVWEREIYINGNAVFTNKANGNRIFVPLR